MKPRGRPTKQRFIKNEPVIRQFSPRGKAGRPNETDLKYEEFEALRLADFIGLKQKEAAEHMQVSQQTFSRVLIKARRSLADALILGKIIRVHGGNYSLKQVKKIKDKNAQKPKHEPRN